MRRHDDVYHITSRACRLPSRAKRRLSALFVSHDKTVVCRQLFARRWRIMKLSKEYSATCHHKYWSERNAR